MKIKIGVTMLAILFMAKISNGQVNQAKQLWGKWNVESLSPQFPEGTTASQKEKGLFIIHEDTENYTKTGFTFSCDGVLTVEGKKFVWVMSADGRTVRVTKGKMEIAVATIIKLSAHKLVFTRPDEGMIVTYVLSR